MVDQIEHVLAKENSTKRSCCSRKQNEGDEKINKLCAYRGTHAHICENIYFINFDLLQNLWIHDSRQLVFFCLLRWCLRRGLTHRDCVVHWFPGPIGRVRLITSVERVYRKPPIKLRFYGHHQLICSSSSICNIWSVEVWVACFAETRSRLYIAMSVINGKHWWRGDFRLVGAQSYGPASFNMNICVLPSPCRYPVK